MLRRTKAVRLVSLLPALWILLSSVHAPAQTHVKIGIVSPTFGHAPFYVAREKGFFRAEGLVGEVIVMNRDDLILQSLVCRLDSVRQYFSRRIFPGKGSGSHGSQDYRRFV